MDSTAGPLAIPVRTERALWSLRLSSSGGSGVTLSRQADRYTFPTRSIFRRNTPVRRIFAAAFLVAAA
ncbi:MAG TPA: hypothetical protein VII52_15320, partial [Gemmatimonadaceae bacterium]